MHTIEISEKKILMEIPSEWEECSRDQVHFILKSSFDVMSGRMSIADFRIKVFCYFTGLKFGWFYHIKQRLGLNQQINENVFLLSQELCDWIFIKNDDDNFELSYETTINHFPVLENRYYGPEDLLADISLSEFKSALMLINQYYDSKTNEQESETFLNYFIATLYRPKDEYGQKVPLTGYVLEPEIFESTPVWQKQIIAIWFSFCVKCLQEEDLEIYGIDVNLSALFPKTETNGHGQKVNLGWTGVILDIAESGVFGNAENTGKTLLYDILLYLLKKHQDQPKDDNGKKL
ncbi:hypothetical protein [Sphingobacterium mizutaii]|uniref:hypothetical protein n=1 Tax=Sphingobacterium mizutaii TaxID=1010 RepID=UPI001628A7B8|nr:hypothetical protein [Sphingobacterium mizutaii]